MARLLIVEDNSELASLIASAAQSRGHTVRAVHSGKAALAALAQERFALAIVDLMLPDFPGKEVLAHLKTLGTRALAMSGVYKGDRFALEATQVHGAAAFFEKPFQMGALLDSVDRVLGVTLRRPDPEPTPHVELFGGARAAASDSDGPDEALGAAPEASEELEDLEELVPLQDDENTPAQAQALRREEDVAPFAERGKVWQAPSQPDADGEPTTDWTRAGSLADTSIPRLLNAYYEARHTGELKLRQGKILKVVYFEGGRPVYAASNVLQERFGQFCVRKGALAAADLPSVIELARESNLRTAVSMVRLGFLTEAQRRSLLEQQVREIIWSTFNWDQGEYQLLSAPARRRDLVRLSVFPGDLILEGALKGQTLVSLRSRMPATRRLFPTEDPPYALYELTLSGPQAQLMAHTDGSKTVEDLLTLTDLPEREALGTLLGLEWAGELRERVEPKASRRITFGL